MFARVLVDIKIKSLNRLFDYIIPESLKDDIKIGSRVIVPFGEQTRLGFVIELVSESELANKEIIDSLDVIETLSEESFLYVDYLKKTNKTLLINILETIIPSELFINYEEHLEIKNSKNLSNDLKLLFNNKNKVKYTKRFDEYKNEIRRLVKNNDLKVIKSFKQKSNEKIIQAVSFNENHPDYRNINKYSDLIKYVKENPNLIRSDIEKQGFSLSSINTLIKNHVFQINEISIDRNVTNIETDKIETHILNKEQLNAFNEIKKGFNTNNTYLLHGITGSGKTEVYMHLIKEALSLNKTILYLVPEITLVSPTINYLKSRFDINITHYNSNLSKGERFDSFNNIINDNVKIVVGTRSSVFLPINNLGLIIVDEEHDKSYDQSERVQYNLIDILEIKSKYNKAPIVLSSATPKISSMYYALNNKYKLLKLTKRATNMPLPKISFVDMKKELEEGNTSVFSTKLEAAINKRLKKKEQVILLYNRKGYASFLLCRSCGHVPKCEHCDISLTYYKDNNELRCSYCNYKRVKDTMCSECGSNKIGLIGSGIEQIYERTKKAFPTSKVLLMDSNTTRRKGSHEQIWLDFKDQKYDILVGTQMVSKGLDFENVTLVGVLMADLELKTPNYLASEHTYNLLTQMVGRSGRMLKGEAVIQGYQLDHHAIKLINKPYEEFYKVSIYEREILKYEPFYEMSQILISDESYLNAYKTALNLKKDLTGKDTFILGPSEPMIKYVRNEYRFLITIKALKMNYENIFEKIKKYEGKSNIYFLKNPEII